ncbi:hypothetical protein C8Q73DRAFT_617447, partial [Cubamyces lactineus]
FPPLPLSVADESRFLQRWHDALSSESVYEVPCAVCACLTAPVCDINLSPLDRSGHGVTRAERFSDTDPVDTEVPGPVLYSQSVFVRDGECVMYICNRCHSSLCKNALPPLSLANGRWIGDVPTVLRDLTFGEELLIARFRRNYCVAHVKGGQGKLRANAIVFEQPTLRTYDVLPPPRQELDECFALIFSGPVKPTNDDYKRTPFIIRHRVVMSALRWLKLNHAHYRDVTISRSNLTEYDDDLPPVHVVHRETTSDLDAE